MSFNKRYLGTRKELKKQYFSLGHDDFVRVYSKIDMLIGGTKKAKEFLDDVLIRNIKFKQKKSK